MLSVKETLLSLTLFSGLVSCAHKAQVTTFDGNWTFTEEEPPRACLNETDVKKLREVLIKCEK